MVVISDSKLKADVSKSLGESQAGSLYSNSDSPGSKSHRAEDILVPMNIQEIRKARAGGKFVSAGEAYPTVESNENKGFFGKCWDFTKRCWDSAKGWWNHTFNPETREIPSGTFVEEKAQKKIDALHKDLGFKSDGEDFEFSGIKGYDRNFLSNGKGNQEDLNFLLNCSDPSIMFAYFVLKLQERGNDNCEKAFRVWLKENEKSKILAKEKHEQALRSVELEKNVTKNTSWLKIGIQCLGGAAAICALISAGAPAVIAGAVAALATGITKVMDFTNKVGEPAVQLVNLGANSAVGVTKENIESLSMEINALQNQASMTAQDLARLHQMNSTLSSIAQAIMQDRKERLSSVRIG
ncbi:MAG: hypothetical protein LBB15_01360 [Puniceicoccales bacterium]|jgi:hypothetical protein|nr:hypothetical protein [Puniceicoccales bacterium]